MKFLITAVLVLSCSLCMAEDFPEDPEQSLKEKLQGLWTRPNYNDRVVIKGNTISLSSRQKPLKPYRTGILQFDEQKGVAVARCNQGYTMWMWYCGESPLEEKTACFNFFRADGRLEGTGTVVYQAGGNN